MRGHFVEHSKETKNRLSEIFKEKWRLGVFSNRPVNINGIVALKKYAREYLRKGWDIKCKNCNKELFISPSEVLRNRQFCCRECYLKYRIGDKHPGWKGGKNNYPYKHIKCKRYKLWRKSVFTRDKFICQMCNKSETYLHPHHIKSFTHYPELRYEISNGITLCKECHYRLHSLLGSLRRRLKSV